MNNIELHRHHPLPTEDEDEEGDVTRTNNGSFDLEASGAFSRNSSSALEAPENELPDRRKSTASTLSNSDDGEDGFHGYFSNEYFRSFVATSRPSRRRLGGVGILLVLAILLSLLVVLAALLRDALVSECMWPTVKHYTTCPGRGIFLQDMSEHSVQCSDSPRNSFEGSPLMLLEIHTNETMQSMEGFGYTLTGGSAQHLSSMDPDTRRAVLEELFGNNEGQVHISYLRLSIGASDLDDYPFSYIDLEPGHEKDLGLANFSMKAHETFLVPIIQEILTINSDVKFLATPWSAPPEFKDNASFMGGTLLPEFYGIYAQYFVLYIQQMERYGINIDAITVQNEPLWGGNNPSMVLTSVDEATFIRDFLAPALTEAGLSTKIIIYDHNADRLDYPMEILDDPTVKSLVHGTAFHLYIGEETGLSKVHDAHPDKSIYFTEQWVSTDGDLEGDLLWHAEHILIGTPRNWARTVLEWNLSSNSAHTPHTDGGCGLCLGAVTIDGNNVTRNAAYYLLAHGAPVIPPGSVRVASSDLASHGVHNVAFLIAESRRLVVILANTRDVNATVLIQNDDSQIQVDLLGRSLSTLSLKYSRW